MEAVIDWIVSGALKVIAFVVVLVIAVALACGGD